MQGVLFQPTMNESTLMLLFRTVRAWRLQDRITEQQMDEFMEIWATLYDEKYKHD